MLGGQSVEDLEEIILKAFIEFLKIRNILDIQGEYTAFRNVSLFLQNRSHLMSLILRLIFRILCLNLTGRKQKDDIRLQLVADRQDAAPILSCTRSVRRGRNDGGCNDRRRRIPEQKQIPQILYETGE